MNLTEKSLIVLNERYFRRNEKNEVVETPEQLMMRTASIAKDPVIKEKIYNYLLNFDFLPNSPTLMNAKTALGQLSACFVLPVEDSMTEIYDAVKYTALIHQSGGGTGFNFSHLRPRGSKVKSTQGVASGPISFMESFNVCTDTVKQGGKRRGANMGILNCNHPDILEFIASKDRGTKFENFNISVAVTDDFMDAVINNKDWNLIWKNEVKKTVKARDIWKSIIHNAWDHGDPGLIFIDEINRKNLVPELGYLESTNPCGEQPLLPYESCNLCSINLGNFVSTKSKDFDYVRLSEIIKALVPFMNYIIDENKYPLPQIRDATIKTRKIGIGVMGWADALVRLEIPYDSEEALMLAEKVMKFINEKCHEESKTISSDGKELNANLTTIAPTGTISIIADCSSGIEPIYALAYKRNLAKTIGTDMFEVNKDFLRIAKEKGFYSEELMSKIVKNKGSCQNIVEVPEEIRKIFKVAHDLHYLKHLNMQAAFQKYTDSACSKTINMSNGVTEHDIEEAYMTAWKLKCKGITIYRDGSKNEQILVTEDLKQAPTPRPRYKDHIAVIREIETGCGVFYNGISWDSWGQMEDFPINSGKGGCVASQETIGRSVSAMLRNNLSPELIIKQYSRIKCNSCLGKDEFYERDDNGHKKFTGVKSCSDGISKQMKDYYGTDIEKEIISLQSKIHKLFNSEKVSDNLLSDASNVNKSNQETIEVCPRCGSTNVEKSRCGTCFECGLSKCS